MNSTVVQTFVELHTPCLGSFNHTQTFVYHDFVPVAHVHEITFLVDVLSVNEAPFVI